MRLSREIRLWSWGANRNNKLANTWAGTLQSNAWGVFWGEFWRLSATVEGPIDPMTGYVCNIQRIDEILRSRVATSLFQRTESQGFGVITIGAALLESLSELRFDAEVQLDLVTLEFQLSPFTKVSVDKESLTVVSLTQSFEFSAAHRLFCSDFSDVENEKHFGKCANPNGHGHNYVVEIKVTGKPDMVTGKVVDLPALDRTVKEIVIDRFDHKHLNLDCPEFANLNPSVENIARVIWKLLHSALAPAKLSSIRVWETPKTCAEYCGDE